MGSETGKRRVNTRSWILRAGEIWLSFLLLKVERGREALSETGEKRGRSAIERKKRKGGIKEASLREKRVLEKLEKSGNEGHGDRER